MKIRGNTVGTPTPRPDWNQTDPKKANYIANKPDLSKLETDVSKLGQRITELESNIWTAGYDIVNYGSSDGGIRIEEACLNFRPLYCVLTDDELTPYYFPLMAWDRYTHTAAFGGCYGDKLVTITYANSEWNYEITQLPTDDHIYALIDEKLGVIENGTY